MVGHSNAGASDLDRASSSLDKAQIGYPSARRLPTPKRHRPGVAMKLSNQKNRCGRAGKSCYGSEEKKWTEEPSYGVRCSHLWLPSLLNLL